MIKEIIKVREWILHIGPLTKVIPLKLFLDMIPSSSANITRVLRGCFCEGSAYMYVVSFQSKGKPPTFWDAFFEILNTSKGASALGMF